MTRLWVGARKGLFECSRRTSGWSVDRVHFLGEPVSMILPDPRDGTIYAGLDLGHFGAKLRRLPRGASEWQECSTPSFPEGAAINDGPPTGDRPAKTKPASLMEIWSLEADGSDLPGGLWAGAIPGGLFHSADGGSSWRLIESLWNRPERWRWFGGGKDQPGIHSIDVDRRHQGRIVLGVSCGGFWRSDDHGETWECYGEGIRADYLPPNLAADPATQDPHRIAVCRANPDVIWMQHHNGIFRSENGGRSWTELTHATPSGFGFAVAAHPLDPMTAWFAPAKKDEVRVPVDARLVVSRTTDGGASFETLSGGLPSVNAYDIVYRHALDVDREGNRLAMGSTTGGLWVSENGGEWWQCVGDRLPPIYCVRIENR